MRFFTDRQVVSGSKDRSVKLHDYYKKTCVKTFYTSSCVLDVQKSYKTLYCGSLNGNLSIFNTNSSWSTFNENIFEEGNLISVSNYTMIQKI